MRRRSAPSRSGFARPPRSSLAGNGRSRRSCVSFTRRGSQQRNWGAAPRHEEHWSAPPTSTGSSSTSSPNSWPGTSATPAISSRPAPNTAPGSRRFEPPFTINSHPPPNSTWPLRAASQRAKPVTAGDVIGGTPGSPGHGQGRARVITDPAQPGTLEPGDILVAPITDPSWTPLFVVAGAVIVDVGALLSHAVIVRRELGIPCSCRRSTPAGAFPTTPSCPSTATTASLRSTTSLRRSRAVARFHGGDGSLSRCRG